MTENVDNKNNEENQLYAKRVERALLLSSIGTAFAVCFLFFNVVLSLSLMQLTGKFSVIPVLVSNNIRSSNEITTKEMFDIKMSSIKTITEIYIRRYIEDKYNFYKDSQYMAYKWGPRGSLRRVSLSSDYSKFYVNEKALKGKIASEMEKRQSEIIEIKSVKNIEGTISWLVEGVFYTIDNNYVMIDDVKASKSNKFNVRVYFRNGFKNFSNEYLNPLGIVILEG